MRQSMNEWTYSDCFELLLSNVDSENVQFNLNLEGLPSKVKGQLS